MSSPQSTATALSWQDLPPAPNDADQLDSIKAHLDLVLLALEAVARIGSEAMLEVAIALNLETVLSDRVTLWRLRQASPLRKGQGGRKKLDVDEARALVLVSCHLAKTHQAKLRETVARLEEVTDQNKPPHAAGLVGDYLDSFCNLYQERMQEQAHLPMDGLTQLALRLLIDLLFYSGSGGMRRLWMSLLDRSLRS
jgi:hypothetical protein